MPSYRETLSPEELEDMLAYLRSLNGAISTELDSLPR